MMELIELFFLVFLFAALFGVNKKTEEDDRFWDENWGHDWDYDGRD